jgi:hypothetical protein
MMGAAAQALHAVGLFPRFAGGLFFAKTGTAAQLARLFIMLVGPQLLLHAASFDQLLESAQRQGDGFFVMDAHPQGHPGSFLVFDGKKRIHPHGAEIAMIPQTVTIASVELAG